MATSTDTILICDDDKLVAESFAAVLEESGWTNCVICTDSRDVLDLLASQSIHVILLDLYMPHIGGAELLPRITERYPEIPVIILTLEDNVDTAVECMRAGAFDFMTKPIDQNRLINSVSHAASLHELRDEVRVLSNPPGTVSLRHPEVFASMITDSDSMRQVFAYVEAVAMSPKSLLVTGESGTGKELVARAVHDASQRTGRFVAVNVAGLDDTVFSDTLFGHTKGAFTGADSVRRGLIEQAAEGTLFLDEIGDLDNAAQVKLLRLLQEHEFYPLGSDEPERSTARVVAATNADLSAKVASGTFRNDLYYRLMSHHVEVPPLRERPEDIRLLLDRFIAEACDELERPAMETPAGLPERLSHYPFPGNVRELQALVHDTISRSSSGSLSISDFTAHPALQAVPGVVDPARPRFSYIGEFPTLAEVESYLVEEALAMSNGNQSAAARLLGISQSTLSRRLAKDRSSEP